MKKLILLLVIFMSCSEDITDPYIDDEESEEEYVEKSIPFIDSCDSVDTAKYLQGTWEIEYKSDEIIINKDTSHLQYQIGYYEYPYSKVGYKTWNYFYGIATVKSNVISVEGSANRIFFEKIDRYRCKFFRQDGENIILCGVFSKSDYESLTISECCDISGFEGTWIATNSKSKWVSLEYNVVYSDDYRSNIITFTSSNIMKQKVISIQSEVFTTTFQYYISSNNLFYRKLRDP